MPSMEPRRRTEVVNVGRARPVPPFPYVHDGDDLTRADRRLDERLQSHHVVALRQIRREAEQGADLLKRDGVIATAGIETNALVTKAAILARRQYNYEVKQQLLRARRESQILAGDDPELAAKCAVLDDDLFQEARLLGLDLDD
jgi:hypothetical protein